MKKKTKNYFDCVCHSSRFITLWQEEKFQVKQCKECKLIYTDPRLPNENYDKIYSKDYFLSNYIKHENIRKKYWKRQLQSIEEFKPTGKILDVGCGTGFFLDVAKSRGWNVLGVEPSDFAASYAREHYHVAVFNGKLSEAKLEGSSFDLITLWDVIAHLPDPLDVLAEIHRILKEGGLLIIKTPNKPAYLFRLVGLLFTFKKSFGRGLLHLPQMIYHFTPQTLAKTLRCLGFNVIKVHQTTEAIKLRFELTEIFHPKLLVPKLLELLLKKISLFESFIVYAKKENVCPKS